MSTYNLVMTARPGGILALAQDSQEFQAHLAPFTGTQPLDLAYASLHTQWLHWSDIPLRSFRIVRDDQGEQTVYLDDVMSGWTLEANSFTGPKQAWREGLESIHPSGCGYPAGLSDTTGLSAN